MPPVGRIAVGAGLTVTILVALHPADDVYVIDVVPADTPVTIPVPEPTVAIAVFTLLHVPPVVVVLNVAVAPTHITVVPLIDAGSGLTVTVLKA